MKNPRMIIKQPRFTERSRLNKKLHNKFTFKVAKNANKIEIRYAVEALFDVDVVDVRTMNVVGKKRRVRTREKGKRPDWKKAIVTVAKGQSISIFDAAD
ncbi:MAG: 50S ribosomal protein L23 [Candidatus Cloacimonetes bacterium 4572_55]|nr:MAG: 50S ribosomal protein L23 [Candidatus Cloacimonetes bacterium 4572_55]